MGVSGHDHNDYVLQLFKVTDHLDFGSQACCAFAQMLQGAETGPNSGPSKEIYYIISESEKQLGTLAESVITIFETMRKHLLHSSIVNWALLAICKQLRHSSAITSASIQSRVKQLFVRDVPGVLASIMNHHAKEPKILESCCRMIVCLLRSDVDGNVANGLVEIVPQLTMAIQANPRSRSLQDHGRMALCELTRSVGDISPRPGKCMFNLKVAARSSPELFSMKPLSPLTHEVPAKRGSVSYGVTLGASAATFVLD